MAAILRGRSNPPGFCTQDRSFGPASTCRSFDFTYFFEQSVLSFTPDVVFLVLSILRLTYLSRKPKLLSRPGAFHVSVKLLSAAILVASSAASLSYLHGAEESIPNMPVWMAAPSLQLVATVVLGVLVLAEHYRSLTPSVLILCYTLTKGLFTAAIARTYQLVGIFFTDSIPNNGVVATCALSCATFFLLFLAELVEKRRLLKADVPQVSSSSFISRSFYLWLIPLLWSGRKKTLTIEDMGTIPPELSAEATGSALYRSLLTTKRGPHYLLFATFKAFGLALLAPAIPRLVLLLATYAQPLLVDQVVRFVGDRERPSEQGWALVGAFIIIYALITLTTSLYWEKVFNSTVMYRGALVANIYSKSLKLSAHQGRSLGGGVASTYMSVDVERVCQGTEFFHEMWAAAASVGLSIALLYSQATWPAFFPLVVTGVLLFFGSQLGKGVGATRKVWLAATDKRVKLISSVINNLLPIKWSAYESILTNRISELRTNEMKQAKKFFTYTSTAAALSISASPACILAVLGPYAAIATHNGKPLDAIRLFTIVTTLNLLNVPLNMLGQFLPVMAASYTSFKRIESFLLMEEKPDTTGHVPAEGSVLEKDEANSQKDGMSELTYSEKTRVSGPRPTKIAMSAASFAWAPDADAFLREITVNLSEDKLYMCVGPVASGKTLLLLSILGETILKSGTYTPPPVRIAYAAQDALIVPGTIRENVLFGCEYDEKRYNLVLDACALRPDLKKLKAGDGTMLGEKGRRLSGGQKQRIALARAVYADAAWTLLDDPLSALDAETEVHVFESLFGPSGLLRNKAVVLVTHNLRLLERADNVLVLNSGRVQYQGTLDEITEKGYDLTFRLATDAIAPPGGKKAVLQPGEEHVDEQEAEEPPISKESQGFTPYFFWAKNATWFNAILSLVLILLGALIRIALQAFLRAWADAEGAKQGKWIGGYAGFSGALLIVNAVSLWQITTVLTYKAGKGFHEAELKGLLSTSPSWIMSTPAGRIINRFSQDVFIADFEFPLAYLNVLVQAAILLGSIIYMLIPAPWLTISILPLGLFYCAALTIYVGTSKQLQHLQAASKSPLYTIFSTTISGLETIRALQVEGHFKKQNDAFLDRSQKPFFYRFAGIRFLRTTLSHIAFIVAVALSALAVGLRHSTSPAFLGLALSNLANLSYGLSNLLISMAQAENGSVSLSRIHEIANLPPEEGLDKVIVSSIKTEDSTWLQGGNIKFEDVRMRYKPDLDHALRGVSFSIKPGQRVGICGRTGSGKSSLILALFRALDRSLMSGKISIDDVNVQDLPLSHLRHSLSLVAQEPFLWHSSLRDNLDPERQLEDSELWTALKHVGMYDAVSGLTEGLETVVEDGGSFSRGQRQLLCLARVLLRKRKIVILDEASSSLDIETDEKMREVIRTELADCTIVAVAHRIATIIDFDMIIVMEDGVVAESGAPRELLASPSSRFAMLASNQGLI